MLIKSKKLEFCGKFLAEHKLKLVLAESMTAGYLSCAFSLERHAGDYFLGSVVSYHDQMKIMGLQIDPNTIQQYGGVSAEVTAEMVAGLAGNFEADIRIANTGFAFECQETTAENPVGTVYIHLQFGD
ncbi:MAG: CinA family protein [Sphingobacterium sp.]